MYFFVKAISESDNINISTIRVPGICNVFGSFNNDRSLSRSGFVRVQISVQSLLPKEEGFMKTSKMMRKVAIVSFLTFLGVLTFSKAVGSQGSPHLIMRGPHGAFQILEPHSITNRPSVKAAPSEAIKPSRSAPIVITRGPHGAAYIVTETGVGGPEGSGVYPGFPELIMRGSHGAFFPK
jgi:hypothetical protein